MTTRQAGTVDQIVFRWDGANPLGNTGFGPVAWSGERSQVARLFRPISHLLRSAGRDTSPALVRLVSDESPTAMLVHRRPGRGVGGRQDTLCHALYGPRDGLDPETCLGLHAWDWEGSGIPLGEVRGPLEPVPLAALGESALAGGRRLAGGLRQAEPELTAVAAEVLRNPDGLYTVLDRMGDDGPCRLLWALHGIFSGVLPREWTFATHDTAESRQLGFMFVSRWSSSPDQDGPRVRTDPWEPPDDLPREVAERLVSGYLGAVERGDAHEFELADALRAALRGTGAVRDSRTLLLAAQDALASLDRRAARERRTRPVPPPERERPARDRPESRRVEQEWPESGRVEQEWPEPRRPLAEGTPQEVSARPPASTPAPAPAPAPSSSSSSSLFTPSSFDPVPATQARADVAAPPTALPAMAVPVVSEALPVVRPTWPEPNRQPRRLPVLGRRSAARGGDQLLAELRSCRSEGERARVIRDAANDHLLLVLSSDPSYSVLTLVVHRIAERWQDWTADDRRSLCESVVRANLFLSRHVSAAAAGPDDAVRAANAAVLYRWAVRPFAAEPHVDRELRKLLPRLLHGTDRVGRGAAEQILTGADDPGITFQVWQKLLAGPAAHSGPPSGPPPAQPQPLLPADQTHRPPASRPNDAPPPAPRLHDPQPHYPRGHAHRPPEPRPAPGPGGHPGHGSGPARDTGAQPRTRTHYPPDEPARASRDRRKPPGTGRAQDQASGDGRAFVVVVGGFGVLAVIMLVVIIMVS
ncbi:hypothetical protein [Streptomyces sp. NPDC003023]|uniref:hypothetical protein n=1 Tax=Streptomyces sp. NPDC003023 TaxID=3364675 RepID=UPI00367F9FC0